MYMLRVPRVAGRGRNANKHRPVSPGNNNTYSKSSRVANSGHSQVLRVARVRGREPLPPPEGLDAPCIQLCFVVIAATRRILNGTKGSTPRPLPLVDE